MSTCEHAEKCGFSAGAKLILKPESGETGTQKGFLSPKQEILKARGKYFLFHAVIRVFAIAFNGLPIEPKN